MSSTTPRPVPAAGPDAAPSINTAEAAFFGRLAGDWWDPRGSSAMLHRITPVRSGFIRDAAIGHFGLDGESRQPLAGLAALDIGCGAGLQAEPLARMGAAVTGIDAAPELIAAARAHAEDQGLAIDYRCLAIEQLASEGRQFDLVTVLEVIEHVEDRSSFLAGLAALLRPGGLAILSTPNRTAASWLVLILGAEYLARAIPRGAHDWRRFMTPAELEAALGRAGLRVLGRKGLSWRPSSGFAMTDDLGVNYFLTITR